MVVLVYLGGILVFWYFGMSELLEVFGEYLRAQSMQD